MLLTGNGAFPVSVIVRKQIKINRRREMFVREVCHTNVFSKHIHSTKYTCIVRARVVQEKICSRVTYMANNYTPDVLGTHVRRKENIFTN